MGTGSSTLQPEEISDIQSITSFQPSQINRLYARFKQLDKGRTGTVAVGDMIAIPELAMNPLSQRIIAVIDSDGRGEVNFKQFVEGLSVFSKDTKREAKLGFAFQVYDVNGDGLIGHEDLHTILKSMVGKNLKDEEIQQLVDQAILEADTIDNDGSISFEEFKRTLFSADLEKILTIEF
ncbi:Calcineurin subunit B type 2 [Blyttiomyces sp. JEL0837]|nr:Calcineurin subunit B type 2 [Blyttiomyces sp. JEL0837]